MIRLCRLCGRRPARAKARRGPAPTLCAVCAPRPEGLERERRQVAVAEARERARSPLRPHAGPCVCAVPVVRTEGPLRVCGLCSREVVSA